MGIRFSRDKEAGETGRRQIHVTASPAACIGLVVVMLLCFVWVFVFGLIVGRGYQPEEAVPELRQFMPSANRTDARNATGTSPTAEPVPHEAKVIKAEDLTFYDRLKKDPAPASAPVPSSPAATRPPSAKSPVTTPEAPSLVERTNSSNGAVFNYVYQVAASKDKAAAEALAQRIMDKGLRTRIESAQSSGTTWYRIQVLFRGTPEDTREMKEILQQLGIARPLLKSKTQD